jgi:hypothetical protein
MYEIHACEGAINAVVKAHDVWCTSAAPAAAAKQYPERFFCSYRKNVLDLYRYREWKLSKLL